ncbi:MAG: hypothetical protein BGO82_11785 [Devosia sp. 67-54]|uniref:DUF4160 domain-containing protein n=1 Tax=unclassified Devosia TaxID=196773 RepID=UPI00086C4A2B|nr:MULTISPECIES: DUF4160 domain-containing protein [unclassified Devosia]MBN9304677.1 DUF4160 domain-containing protein [Devosia sp.]ODU55494.1 MAG: hypothetical protein ABS99_07410 [Acetobacteraceae bacterium SCN 69-10]OJX15342.1 MAG: hypothetical protein BGO82_11785 [Devosia sp. 67-54]
MPTVFEWKGWRFVFYSLDSAEPPHIHIRKDRKETKVWLESMAIARNKRCTDKELNELLDVVRLHQQEFLERWNEHFGN